MKQLFILLFLLLSFHLQSQSIRIGRNVTEQSSFLLKDKNEIHVISGDTLIIIDMIELKIKGRIPLNNKIQDLSQSYFEEVSIHDELYFTERKGGIVYKYEDNSFRRIDHSFTHKMNIGSTLFVYNDTIFKYGGYGFWSQRNFFIYFDELIGEWEMIPPINSKSIPEGTSNSIVKVIGNDFYVFGGDKLNSFNPFESTKNDELWKFNIKDKKWILMGKLRVDFNKIDRDFSFGDKYVLIDHHLDELYIVDIINNSFQTYSKTQLQYKLNPFLDPIFHKGLFYCFTTFNTQSDVYLTVYDEEELFGQLMNNEKLYKDNSTIINSMIIFLFLLVLGLVIYIYRKNIKKRNLIIVCPEEIVFKRRIIPLNIIKIQILNLLLNSKEEVNFSEIMNLCEDKRLDYSHNTRVINKLIEQLNFKIKFFLCIEEDPIQFNKSEKDKRIKVYSINKSLFYVKK